jgi:hypothetical protein
MEGLRIRIPQVFHCIKEDCLEYVYRSDRVCMKCRSLSRMRQEMAATTLASEPKIVHRPTLCGDTGGGR